MTDTVAVDASLALKWVLPERHSAEAGALLSRWQVEAVRMIAPPLLLYEAGNVLHQRVRRGQLARRAATEAMEQLLFIGADLVQENGDCVRAIELASELQLPAAYDAQYLAVAEREGCELWTADERLWNTVKEELAWVRWLGQPGLELSPGTET